MIYCFGSFQLDTRLMELRRNDIPVPIVPRAFDLLRLLIENRDRLVSKDELIETIWSVVSYQRRPSAVASTLYVAPSATMGNVRKLSAPYRAGAFASSFP